MSSDAARPSALPQHGVGRLLWVAGRPVRSTLIALIVAYRASVGRLAGGRCRFHPSCSAYAEQAVRELGAARGTALSIWRVLRCSPLTRGGIDYPPVRRVSGGRASTEAERAA